MKKLWFVIPVFIFIISRGQEISLDSTLRSSKNEFSGLAKWNNKILLMTQSCWNIKDTVYMIDSTEMSNAIKNIDTPLVVKQRFPLKNLFHYGEKMDVVYLGNNVLPKYDGFEASVVKNDTIYFSIETDSSQLYSYIVKGTISRKDKNIQLLHDTLNIHKPYIIDNAGFESLALLGKDSLIAFFECNKDSNAKAYVFPSSFKNKPREVQWASPLYFRLTDVYALNDTEFIGINHLYSNTIRKDGMAERDAYLKGVKYYMAEQYLTDINALCNMDISFTRLVKLKYRNNMVYWEPFKFISVDEADNYEGIIKFENGYLMIVDGEPGSHKSKLSYFSN